MQPDNLLISLPRLLKTWVDPVTYRVYMSASLAETKPLCIDNSNGFKQKDKKSLDVLKSDIHILGLKKQRAQAEIDMFSEALARVAEFEGTDDGGHAYYTYTSVFNAKMTCRHMFWKYCDFCLTPV